MLKRMLSIITLLCCVINIQAQGASNIKLGIETGILPLSKDSENLGFFFNVEPKIKVIDNIFIGLRIGVTLNSHAFENNDEFQYIIDSDQNNAVLSFTPTIDYYLNEYYFRPYLGLGIGFHILADPLDVFRATNASEGVIEGSVNKRPGFLLRGGFESDKLRFGVEYTFIPKGDIEIPSGQIIGAVGNSYFGLSVGFTIIGGKRSPSK